MATIPAQTVEVPEYQSISFSQQKARKTLLIYEFIGSAFVTTAFTLSNFNSTTRALTYFIVFLLFSHISGGHFNPATTLACFIADKQAGKHLFADSNTVTKQLRYTLLA